MKALQFAIIGAGRIGIRHAKHIVNNGKLVAVCDIIPEKADNLAQAYQALAYYTIDDLLEANHQLDLIAICTPNGLHAIHSIKSLRSGYHVLCEKPMAINVYDCKEMIKTAEQFNRQLFAVKQNRFNPPIVKVKELIDQGALGKIYSTQLSCFWNRNKSYYTNSWKGTDELDGGTLFTQFSHFVDLLYWMIGDIEEAKGFSNNFAHQEDIDFEDTGVVALKFYNGVVGTLNYTVNSHQKNMEGSLTIFGEKGTVKIGGEYLNELEYQNIEGLVIKHLPKGNTANNYGSYQGSMSNHDKVYENVVDVLRHGAQISTSAYEAMKTVEIIEKIYAQIRHGIRV